VWYEKIEEIYGWQKLDDVLETTADGVRAFYDREHAAGEKGTRGPAICLHLLRFPWVARLSGPLVCFFSQPPY
jgi:hypothetical protein